MGQEEVLKILKSGDKLTAQQIFQRSDVSQYSIQQSLKRLIKDVSEQLLFRPLTPEEKKERFGKMIGVKVNLYWLDE